MSDLRLNNSLRHVPSFDVQVKISMLFSRCTRLIAREFLSRGMLSPNSTILHANSFLTSTACSFWGIVLSFFSQPHVLFDFDFIFASSPSQSWYVFPLSNIRSKNSVTFTIFSNVCPRPDLSSSLYNRVHINFASAFFVASGKISFASLHPSINYDSGIFCPLSLLMLVPVLDKASLCR